MNLLMVLLLLFLLFIAWEKTNPRAYHALVAELQRRWRLYVIKREGERMFKSLEQKMHQSATKKRIPPAVVNKFMSLHKPSLVDEFGRQLTNEILGEPTHWERYF